MDVAHSPLRVCKFDGRRGSRSAIVQQRGAHANGLVGSATGANSEKESQCLERGKQHWFRVRTVRAGKVGPWSEQVTRVANI
ncbi:MAG: hypothetical protein NTX50_11375 [Candidatus Sumerlaeota bacterium]|nr:hypothetical protein [Candidatus Sumerlaeota bacterium]